jgi:hypothetical protein
MEKAFKLYTDLYVSREGNKLLIAYGESWVLIDPNELFTAMCGLFNWDGIEFTLKKEINRNAEV